jgi:hypothetical protein
MLCTIAVQIGLSSTQVKLRRPSGVPRQTQELKDFPGRLLRLTTTTKEGHMGHIDWLVNREGVMFAPNVPGVPADGSGEAGKAGRKPGETSRSDEDDRVPKQMEIGDPHDGP